MTGDGLRQTMSVAELVGLLATAVDGLRSPTSAIELLRLLGKVGDGLPSTTSAAAVDGSVYVHGHVS